MGTNPSSLIRGSVPDLDARDPEFLRRQLPVWRALSNLYFRADVRGFERIPGGPVLLVGNHSGGLLTPDTLVLLQEWHTRFTVDRPLYMLAHAMATGVPVMSDIASRAGALTAGDEAARAAFARDASVLVYPGGDREVYRPWSRRHCIDLAGRQGFLRLAHAAGVPVVPVVADGGHDTMMVLSDGHRLARRLRLDRLARIKVLPLSLGLPFGLGVGGLPPHLPLPAKIRLEVLAPIDLRARYGDAPDWGQAYGDVTDRMQAALSRLAAEHPGRPFQ